MTATWRIVEGDCRASLAALPQESVQCCVTSPPYWGLRDYGHEEQIGNPHCSTPSVRHRLAALAEDAIALRALLARHHAPSPRSEAEGGPVVREDWRCEAGTTSCPGTQGSLAKDWICTACGRKAHAPVTWRDKGLTAKPKTYEPDAPVPAESATKEET